MHYNNKKKTDRAVTEMEGKMPGKAGPDVTNLRPNFLWCCFRVNRSKGLLGVFRPF